MERLVENVIWGERVGWKRQIYRHMGRGLKRLKKPSYDIWRFLSRHVFNGFIR